MNKDEERRTRKEMLEAKIDRLDSAVLTAAALRWLVAEASKTESRKANECGQIIAQKFADLEASRMAARKALQNFELSPVESIRKALLALGIDPLEHVKEQVKGKADGSQ